jgi:hypothetical protein
MGNRFQPGDRSRSDLPGPPPSKGNDSPPAQKANSNSLLYGLFLTAILIAGTGFFIHAAVDLFAWAWDLWGNLIH